MANVVNDKIMSDKQLLTVAEVSRLYNFSVQKVYRFIKSGKLSKDSEGKIALSEALRVFGAIPSETGIKQSLNETIKQPNDDVIALLKQQIERMERDLQDFKEREKQALEREERAAKERDRLFLLLERQAGVVSPAEKSGGLFGKLFK